MTEDFEMRDAPAETETHVADEGAIGPPVLRPERYMDKLGAFDLSEAEKLELLRTLWDLLIAVADLHLGFDPIHMLVSEEREISSESRVDPVKFEGDTETK